MPKPSPIRRVAYSALRWDTRAKRYRAPSGKFIGPEAIRAVIEADIDATKARMRVIGERIQRGEITALEGRGLQAVEIRCLHLAQLAAAKGGFHALTQADYGRVGQIIRSELVFLDRRAEIAANDAEYRASEQFVNTWASYGDAGILTFEAQRRAEELSAGRIYVENELEPGSHHCKPKGGRESCEEQTAKGRVHYSEMVGTGKRACGPGCRCFEKFFSQLVPTT